MKGKLKVAVIGGGSSYTPELIDGLIRHHADFPVTELYLADIEQGKDKLAIVGALAKRMVEKSGLPIEISLTTNRREAIESAQYVLTQIRVGMLDARANDERIPLRYGCIGQETTGAGGFAKAIRTIPVILDICKDMEELAPDAFLVNFTNPAGIVTQAVLKHTKIKSIGLCNLPIGTQMNVAKLMDVRPEQVDIEMAGINHLNWTTKIGINGQDMTDEVLAKFSNTKGLTVKNIPDYDWGEGFIDSLGMLPCSYLRYYYLKDQMLKDQLSKLGSQGTRADAVKKVENELFKLYQDPNLKSKPPQLEQRGGAYYSEAAINLISAIHNNQKNIQIVNVKNGGIIDCLPSDASIEVGCVIYNDGAAPLQLSRPIHAKIRGLLQVVKAYEELTVEAAVKGDYASALQALTIHPLVGNAPTAKLILEDILHENRHYLPQFN